VICLSQLSLSLSLSLANIVCYTRPSLFAFSLAFTLLGIKAEVRFGRLSLSLSLLLGHFSVIFTNLPSKFESANGFFSLSLSLSFSYHIVRHLVCLGCAHFRCSFIFRPNLNDFLRFSSFELPISKVNATFRSTSLTRLDYSVTLTQGDLSATGESDSFEIIIIATFLCDDFEAAEDKGAASKEQTVRQFGHFFHYFLFGNSL
jgi:hypothetical protein